MSVEDPQISVIMSVYNTESYLRDAIDSILNQTFSDFELLIIDDCSSDSSVDIIESYTDPRVRLLKNKENMGIVKISNHGLREARGEFIARLDSDDLAMPTRLEKQISILKQHPETALVASLYDCIDSSGKQQWTHDYWHPSPEEIFYTLIFNNCIAHSCVMYKKSTVQAINGYDEDLVYCDDWDLWFRLAQIGKVEMIPETLCKWRDHSTSIQKRLNDARSQYEQQILKRNIAFFCGNSIGAEDIISIGKNISRAEDRSLNWPLVSCLNQLNKSILLNSPEYLDKPRLEAFFRHELSECMKFMISKYGWHKSLGLLLYPSLLSHAFLHKLHFAPGSQRSA